MRVVPILGPAPGDVWGQGLHGQLGAVGTEGCGYRQEGWWGWRWVPGAGGLGVRAPPGSPGTSVMGTHLVATLTVLSVCSNAGHGPPALPG